MIVPATALHRQERNEQGRKGTVSRGKGALRLMTIDTTTTNTTTRTDKTTYTVTAKRWKHGWELHVDGIGVTQSKTLATAEQMVRDYIETLTDQDVSGADVVITPELGALGKKVKTVRAQVDAAERAQRDAAQAKRQLADDLRSAGLSVSDTAAILGVSRGRVSQLSNAS